MALTIPIEVDAPHFQVQMELEGVSYTLTFRWNERDTAWYLTLGDGEGVELVTSKVVIDLPLFGRRRSVAGRPPGTFVAVDTTGAGRDAGYEDLGDRVQLLYFDASEVDEALA